MKRSKILKVILLTIVFSIFFSTIVLGTSNLDLNYDETENNEPVPTSNLEGTPSLINEQERNENQIDDQKETYDGDLYIFEDNYDMDKLVDGNVYIIGNDIKISGMVNGSVFICASKVEIAYDAYIACQLFIAAKDVTINGMALDVYSSSNTLEIGDNALIYRQLISIADKMKLSGTVGRDVKAYGNDIEINEESLNVYGDFTYEAKSEISNINDKVDGNVIFKKAEENVESLGSKIARYIISAISTIVFDILIYLTLLFFAPKFVNKSKEYVSIKALIAFGIGLAVVVAIPILALLLCFTRLFTGIAMLSIALYVVLLMINALVVVTVSNEFIADKFKIEDKLKKIGLIIPVSLVFWGLRKIPVVGTIISAIVCLCGVGIVILYQFDKKKE